MYEKILVVDDDFLNVDYLRAILESRNYEVIMLTDPFKVVQTAKNKLPDLILLDIIMPGLNGYEICENIKQSDELNDIPVLFLSGLQEKEDIVKGFEVGGVDYVNKPFSKEELLARIKTHLQLKRLREKLLQKIEENENLLRILSHDLANQLAGIIGFSEIGVLKSNEDTDEYKYLKKIQEVSSSSKELIGFIREMLAMESGKLEVSLKPYSIKKFLHSAYNTFENRLEKKEITLIKNYDLELEDIKVLVEPVSFQNSVLNNIISNAIKFSYPQSNLEILIKDEEKRVKLIFKDHGIGIKTQHLSKLFSTKEQTSLPGTQGERATGFGMPLVKKYLEKYNGEINIRSKHKDDFPDDHGTEIELVLNKQI